MDYTNNNNWFDFNEESISEKSNIRAIEFNRVFEDLLKKHNIEPIKIK